MSPLNKLTSALAEHGLRARGSFTAKHEDNLPSLESAQGPRTLVLIGNIGSSIWPSFSNSAEFHDGNAHALDRWSRRIGEQLAADFSGLAIFPFDGPPYWPFLTWTQKAEGLIPSPLGLNFHPHYGLWHAYRFALLLPFAFDEQVKMAKKAEALFDCASCSEQACLHSCPVKAFDARAYDTNSCISHLNNNRHSSCNSDGCLARHACPVGQEFAYEPAQAHFHMQAFITALSKPHRR